MNSDLRILYSFAKHAAAIKPAAPFASTAPSSVRETLGGSPEPASLEQKAAERSQQVQEQMAQQKMQEQQQRQQTEDQQRQLEQQRAQADDQRREQEHALQLEERQVDLAKKKQEIELDKQKAQQEMLGAGSATSMAHQAALVKPLASGVKGVNSKLEKLRRSMISRKFSNPGIVKTAAVPALPLAAGVAGVGALYGAHKFQQFGKSREQGSYDAEGLRTGARAPDMKPEDLQIVQNNYRNHGIGVQDMRPTTDAFGKHDGGYQFGSGVSVNNGAADKRSWWDPRRAWETFQDRMYDTTEAAVRRLVPSFGQAQKILAAPSAHPPGSMENLQEGAQSTVAHLGAMGNLQQQLGLQFFDPNTMATNPENPSQWQHQGGILPRGATPSPENYDVGGVRGANAMVRQGGMQHLIDQARTQAPTVQEVADLNEQHRIMDEQRGDVVPGSLRDVTYGVGKWWDRTKMGLRGGLSGLTGGLSQAVLSPGLGIASQGGAALQSLADDASKRGTNFGDYNVTAPLQGVGGSALSTLYSPANPVTAAYALMDASKQSLTGAHDALQALRAQQGMPSAPDVVPQVPDETKQQNPEWQNQLAMILQMLQQQAATFSQQPASPYSQPAAYDQWAALPSNFRPPGW